MKDSIRFKICEFCSGPMEFFHGDYSFSRKKCRTCGNIVRIKGNYPMKLEYYISVVEFLMGRDETYPPTPEMVMNYNELIPKINQLLECFYISNPEAPRRPCNSGYRPAQINANVSGAAKKSSHMVCMAIDLGDNDELLGKWCMDNFDKVKELGLYMESLETTHAKPSKWVHIQTRPTNSNPFKP